MSDSIETTMRAKMYVSKVEVSTNGEQSTTSERIYFSAVARALPYPADGSDEDNTFARWSPSADLNITIANPNLWGQFFVGQKFYVDFTLAPDSPAAGNQLVP